MANVCKLLCLVVFFTIIAKGISECSIYEITVGQSETGKQVEAKSEWGVTVQNPCPCTVLNLKLSCPGFQSVEDVSLLSKSGDECLLNNGDPFYAFSNLTFNYAWDSMFDLKPLSCEVACS